MSFASFTHRPPQQLSPHSHWASVVQPPPVPDDGLVDDELEEELLAELLAEEVLVLPEEGPVVLERAPP
jgi:hypothetical protein